MATRENPALAHWHRMEGLVQAWLRERQQLLYLLCAVQGLRGLEHDREPLDTRVSRLCEVLVDYISAGYFEIYQELAREARWVRHDNGRLIRHMLSRLEASTDEALRFNEDFDTPEQIRDRQNELPARLSRLLELLEERFALEDQLILSIHHDGSAEVPVLQ